MNPVAKNAHKFNKSAVHRDKKNDYKRNKIDLDEQDFDIDICQNCGKMTKESEDCCDNPDNDIIDLGE